MENKYKVTITGFEGDALLVYDKKLFKSCLIDFKPHLSELQLAWFLRHIPLHEDSLAEHIVIASKGKISLDKIEPTLIGTNRYIAFFCDLYKEKTGIAYKVSASDAGKVKQITIDDREWMIMVTTYFDSKNFLFDKKWSISNMIKYWNELRLEAFAPSKKEVKSFPLPYDHLFFVKLDTKGQQDYWAYLRDNGYAYEINEGRNGKWVKRSDLFG